MVKISALSFLILYVIIVAVFYIVNVAVYAVTGGRHGTLNLKKVAARVPIKSKSFSSIWWLGGGKGGSSGGGSSGGW